MMMLLLFRGSNVESAVSTTCTNWEYSPDADRDSLTVCLLVTDKEERDFFKLIAFHTPTGNEYLLTEVPYREDCCIARLKGNCIRKAKRFLL